MEKNSMSILLAAFAAGSLAAAELASPYLLKTENTTMAFVRSGDVWRLVHYGDAISSPADAQTLAWAGWSGGNDIGQRKDATYSVHGAANVGNGVNKFGGLAVTHADGVLTTDPIAIGSEKADDAAGAEHVVFKYKDKAYPFFITQHFRALAACDTIETWVELRHDEPSPVKLSRMDSAAFVFPLLANDFRVQYMTGQWASENQLRETSLERGQTVAIGSRSGVRDAWENNASFMLSIGGAADETHGRVLGGVLAWSGTWHITLQRDHVDCLELRAGVDTPSGPYVLEPGRTLTTPKLVLTCSSRGKGQVSRNIHRWARKWQLPAGDKLRPVLLNSWEGSYFSFTEKVLHDMMDGVKELGGELFVLDDGWFGTGKYARDDKNRDKVGLGDWIVNPEKLPNGLSGLAQEAKTRGLKFGFWVEPEMVNTNSWLYETHPDWIIREPTRPVNVGRGRSQTVLDYANPAVRENIFKQLDALYSVIPDLAYIKWDANADFMNIGSPYLPADRQANMWYDYTVGLYSLLERVRAKYPAVDIQACSSGGGHLDYGFLHYADEYWGSDDSDARERVFIQWGASQFYPASVIASHVTAVPNHQTGRTVSLKYRFDVAMSARLGFELHPKDMTSEEIEFAKRCVADYKRIRPTVQQGDLYRLVSPYGQGGYASLMYVDDSRKHAVVFLWGLSRGGIRSDYLPPIPVAGLDPAKRYRVNEINRPAKGAYNHVRADRQTVGGDALMSSGLYMRLRKGDYDSAVVELTAE